MKPVTSHLGSIAIFILFPIFLFWKKSKRGTVVLLLVAALTLASCFQHYYLTNTQRSVDAAELKKLQNSDKYFIVHFNDSKVFGLNNISVNGDKVEGDLVQLPPEHQKYLHPRTDRTNRVKSKDKLETVMEVHLYYPQVMPADQTHVSLPISAVNRLDVYEYDRHATNTNHILSWIGTALATAAAVTLIAFAIACNCPQVYVNNNGQYEFKSGVYSGAVYSTLERSDYLPLEGIKPMNDKYQFRIGNVDYEEQYINHVQLLIADHPAGIKVLADRHGKILSYKEPSMPVKAMYNETIDVTQELKLQDADPYSFDSKANDNGLSSVLVNFDRPAKANKAKLLVHAGNSKWSGYLYKEFASLFGEGYEKWRKQQEQAAPGGAQQWQIDQGLPLKVSVETNKGWQYVDHFALTGNTASRNMIMEIDLENVKPGKINIRLESAFQFWDLDKVAMDFSEEQTITSRVLDAVSVTRNDGTINLDELFHQDKKYTHLTGKDFVNIEFSAAPENGSTISLFLVTSGYYHSQSNFKGKPDLNSLLKFKEKKAFDEFSRKKYTGIQETLAKGVVTPTR